MAPDELQFKIDAMRIAPASDQTSTVTIDPGLTLYRKMSPLLRQLSRGVVKLTIAQTEVCSGFLVAGAQIVTAYHCLEQSKDYADSANEPTRRCSDITIAFDYNSSPYAPMQNPLCKSVLPASRDAPIDIAVLTFSGTPPGSPGRELALASSDPKADQPLVVLEHPWGLPIGAATGCHVQGPPTATSFAYECNTLGGASGAPVLSPQGEVVGVHINGYMPDDATQIDVFKAYYQQCQEDHCPANTGTLLSQLKQVLR